MVSSIWAAIYRMERANNGSGCAEHPLHVDLDPFEIAYLRGGQAAVAEAATSSLIHCKTLNIDGDKVRVDRGTELPQHRILDELSPALNKQYFDLLELRKLTQQWKKDSLRSLSDIRTKLEEHGFILTDQDSADIAMRSALICLIPLVIAVPKVFIGADHSKPIGFLLILILIHVAIAVALSMKLFRTTRGDAALAYLNKKYDALSTTARSNSDVLNPLQIATVAGLFGPAVFATGMIDDFYKKIAPPSSGGGGCGSGCGSSGCGGGGCGGGCGGCGG